MKAVLLDNNKVHLIDCPEPRLQNPLDVKVKVCYASICGYEMMVYAGTASPESNFLVGHETSGIVVEIGEEVTTFQVGDRVTFDLFLSCGECIMCRCGKFAYCEDVYSASGQMREYVVRPQKSLHKLHDQLSLLAGCQIEHLTMGMRALERAQLDYGKTMLILGGGAAGLMMLKLALLHPVSSVAVVEPNPQKRELALRFGASATFDPYSPDFFNAVTQTLNTNGFDTVVEASGKAASAKTAFHFVNRGGALIYFGLYGMNYEMPLNLFSLYWKDITISAVYPKPNLTPDAIELAPRLALEELITAKFPFEQAAQAFAEKASGNHAKVVLDFTEGRFDQILV